MKKSFLLLFVISVILLSCGKSTKIENTTWQFKGGENYITFLDSVCMIFDVNYDNSFDTIYSKYEIKDNTIIFNPYDEWIVLKNLKIDGKIMRDEENNEVLELRK